MRGYPLEEYKMLSFLTEITVSKKESKYRSNYGEQLEGLHVDFHIQNINIFQTLCTSQASLLSEAECNSHE